MRASPIKRLVQDTDITSYVLAFFQGQTAYLLKLVSIIKILEYLSLQSFPLLMLGQGIITFAFVKLCDNLSKKSKYLYYSFNLIIAGLTVSLAYHPTIKQFSAMEQGWIVSCFFFFASTNFVNSLDVSIGNMISNKTSILKNPSVSTYLTLSKELGILSSALFIFFGSHLTRMPMGYLIPAIPFALCFLTILLVLPHIKTSPITNKAVEVRDKYKEFNKFHFPFVSLIISLMTVMLVVKNLQSFAVMVGINELRNSTSQSVSSLFSQIAFVETGLILAFLIFSSIYKGKTPTWSRGFKVFFGTQTLSSLGLFAFMNPFLLIGTGMMRKIIQHTYVDSSKRILMSMIPSQVNLLARSYIQRNVNFASYFILAILISLSMYKIIPLKALWLITAMLAASGFYFRKKLYNVLTEFQVANIVRTDIYDAANCCYSLSDPEAISHSAALMSLLKNRPRPFVAKAIVRALGEIGDHRSIPILIDYYHEMDREDIQLSVVQSLLKFKSHEIDLFLVKTLETIVKEQVSLGQIRRSIFKAITTRISKIAIPYLINILNDNDEDFRIVANAIIVLGEVAVERNDPELFNILAKYLDPKYIRRVRTNAIMFLYKSKQHRVIAKECFETFLTSNEAYDRSAVAYLAGELQMKSMIPFVLENSLDYEHKNSTLLVSLLKQEYPESYSLFADYILDTKDDNDLYTAINQLSAIESSKVRYKVYFHILDNYPAQVNNLLDYLRLSQRDFDQDRQVIKKESSRLGIEVNEDNDIFKKNRENESLKSVA